MVITLKRVWALLLFIPFLFSCATYNANTYVYFNSVSNGNYNAAQSEINNNKLLQKKRNRLLYYVEQGKLYHLKKQYDSSNLFLNAADNLIENRALNIGNLILSNLSSPMAADYKQEDFEIFMVHYYKALNYLQQGNLEEAVVEARRIGLSNSFQKDKFSADSKKYTQDAFSLILQGLLYEANNEINNAFISYRNAVDLYLNNNGSFYRTVIPEQLKIDLIRTGNQMGFYDLVDIYKTKLKISNSIDTTLKSELIIFFENGIAPTKQEQNFVLTSVSGGSFFLTDAWGIRQNVNFNGLVGNDKLNSIRTLRVAMPVYQLNTQHQQPNNIIVNNQIYTTSLVQNINDLSTSLLRERWLKELTNAAIRQISKKAVEKGSEAASKKIAENNTKDTNKDGTKKTDEQKKKDKEKNEAIAETVGFLVNVFNTASEKADTRGWQTLPAFISYVRFPLQEGQNTVSFEINGIQQTININSKKGIQFYNFISWK
jgi:hypothetical protein